MKALRKTPPPARRGFTVADQVNQLVSASEADPDRGFMARLMALCSLPRKQPRQPPPVQAPAWVLLFWWWPERWAVVMLVYFLVFYLLLLFLPWSMRK